MSDSDDSHSRSHSTRHSTQEESEDPGPRRMRFATDDVNDRRCFRA
jgi:hypothetical protein